MRRDRIDKRHAERGFVPAPQPQLGRGDERWRQLRRGQRPIRREAGRRDLAMIGERAADEARVRPVARDAQLGFVRQRGEEKLAAAAHSVGHVDAQSLARTRLRERVAQHRNERPGRAETRDLDLLAWQQRETPRIDAHARIELRAALVRERRDQQRLVPEHAQVAERIRIEDRKSERARNLRTVDDRGEDAARALLGRQLDAELGIGRRERDPDALIERCRAGAQRGHEQDRRSDHLRAGPALMDSRNGLDAPRIALAGDAGDQTERHEQDERRHRDQDRLEPGSIEQRQSIQRGSRLGW